MSEFVALRVKNVRLVKRAIVIEDGKGGKRREVPMRPDLARLVALHVGGRSPGSLVVSRQRIGQIVRQIARGAEIGRRIYPHLLRHTMTTRLPAIGMDITDAQKFLGHENITTTRTCAETSVAMLRRKFDRVTSQTGQDLVQRISKDQGEGVGAFAADLLSEPRRLST